MVRIPVLVVTILLMTLTGCSKDDPTNTDYSPENIVRMNADLVRKAAEAFARENNGDYPLDLRDKSEAGRTLIDLLPNGQRLWNSFKGEHSEPVEMTATRPGEVGYRPYIERDAQFQRHVKGYIITGFGESTQILSITKNFPDSILSLEELVMENAYIVQHAVELFAEENDGYYPSNVSLHTTPAGNTLTDLLPGGQRLMNPFTTFHTEPVNGIPAVNPGEVGYVGVVLGDNEIVGYEIAGFGHACEIIVLRVNAGWPYYHPFCD